MQQTVAHFLAFGGMGWNHLLPDSGITMREIKICCEKQVQCDRTRMHFEKVGAPMEVMLSHDQSNYNKIFIREICPKLHQGSLPSSIHYSTATDDPSPTSSPNYS